MGLLGRLFGKPSRTAFAKTLVSSIRATGDPRALEYNADGFCLVFDDGGKINLANMYREHCDRPRSERQLHLAGLVQAFAQTGFEMPDDFEDVKPDLRPKIWSRSTFADMALQQRIQGGEQFDSLLIPLGSHLCVGLVYDLPTSMRSIGSGDLETWGTTPYEAMEVARHNLEETTVAFAAIGESHYASITGDNYDSCRVLLLDTIRNLEIKGDPVAMIPNRDALYVTGTEDEVGLRVMAELTEQGFDEPRPLAAIPLRLEGDNWVDWMPSQDHPLHPQFRMLELKTMLSCYESQKQLLEQVFGRDGTDIFLASLCGVEEEDGNVFSYCVWSDGVDSLLPESHQVMFFREGQDVVAQAEWNRVVEIVGDLMEPADDLYPPRSQGLSD